jgi:DNA repair protein SbcC/Rad50
MLARDLVEGRPCPVCGSAEHPAPAHIADEVDDAMLDAARAGLEEARRLQHAHRESCAWAEASAAQARGQLEALLASLPEGSTTAQAEAEALECDGACRKLAQAVAAVPDADELVAAAWEAVTAAEQRRAAAREGDRAAATGLAAAQARAGELGSAVPEELRSPAVLEQALGDAQAEADRREAALKVARDAHAAARERLVGAERDLKAAADAKDTAAAAEAAAGESFAEALALSEFETAEAFEAALMDERALAEADAAVRAHGTALSEAKGQLVQALTSVTDHPVTGALGDVRAQAEATAERSREAQRLHTAAEARLAALKAARVAVDELDRACEEVAASYAVVGKLADVAAGQEGARVSFQRWVLGRYLDDVLIAASRRLAMMSKERYRLERQKETSDLRRASGLDLAVFDSWSNRSRPAVTLSGGESFLAALSLALGLAETVQEQSGGTRLETIFVDEGFGALDQSALDQAMDALAELRDSGRLVGVISHVPELRQVIDARLEVRGGPGGSSARFIVP